MNNGNIENKTKQISGAAADTQTHMYLTDCVALVDTIIHTRKQPAVTIQLKRIHLQVSEIYQSHIIVKGHQSKQHGSILLKTRKKKNQCTITPDYFSCLNVNKFPIRCTLIAPFAPVVRRNVSNSSTLSMQDNAHYVH